MQHRGGDAFGRVAVDGNTAVVGATVQADGRGAVYIFQWNGVLWLEVQKLSPAILEVGDYFGSQVVISGGDMVVGAHGRGEGAAFAYEFVNSRWVLRQEFHANNAGYGATFGFPIILTGQSLVIGAPKEVVGGIVRAGAVYTFERQGGSWVEDQRIISNSPAFGHSFGSSLQAFDGGFAVGGSPFGVSGTSVFERVAGSWVEVAHLFAGAGVPSIGLPDAPRVAHVEREKVHLFRREAGSWIPERVLVGGDSQLGDNYGSSTWIQGQELFVGSPGDDDSSFNGGAVYVHDLGCLNSFEVFGHCASGAPCANHDPQAGCTNSSGSGALLSTTPESTNSVSADDLKLVVSNLPSDAFGLVYMGPNRTQVAFGDGLRVVEPGPPVSFYRFTPMLQTCFAAMFRRATGSHRRCGLAADSL